LERCGAPDQQPAPMAGAEVRADGVGVDAPPAAAQPVHGAPEGDGAEAVVEDVVPSESDGAAPSPFTDDDFDWIIPDGRAWVEGWPVFTKDQLGTHVEVTARSGKRVAVYATTGALGDRGGETIATVWRNLGKPGTLHSALLFAREANGGLLWAEVHHRLEGHTLVAMPLCASVEVGGGSAPARVGGGVAPKRRRAVTEERVRFEDRDRSKDLGAVAPVDGAKRRRREGAYQQ
jgi:hypothetical protein